MQRTANIKRPKAIDELIEPALMARLSQLDVASRKIFAGKLKGERRSKKRGESVEFADHRSYVSGDDLRHIDWNLFARLDHLFLKLFLEEEDLSLHIVLDCSASHDCGEPNKFLFMQRLAMSLSYIGLVNLNRVALSAIGSDEGAGTGLTTIRDLRGRRRVQDIAQFLCSLEPTGTTPFTEACKRIAITRRGKGVMIVLSDFFIKEGYDTGLRLLVGHGYDVFAIQVLSPEEVEPKITGDLRLKDVEDADLAEVTISAPLLKRYKANLTAYCDQLHEFCAKRDIVHMTVKSDTPIDSFVLDYLRRRGLLK
jgi:uncharacterized protein (DUF58 family)